MCASQAATLLDQACNQDDVKRTPAARAAAAPGGDAAQQQQLVRRASKALLKQVEETRRKYTSEVEGLKAELQLLNRQAQKDRRDADLASVTAAAAKKAALEATEELERVNDEVLRAKHTVQQLNRSGAHTHKQVELPAASAGIWCSSCPLAQHMSLKAAVGVQ